jgi:hypothetical protein
MFSRVLLPGMYGTGTLFGDFSAAMLPGTECKSSHVPKVVV